MDAKEDETREEDAELLEIKDDTLLEAKETVLVDDLEKVDKISLEEDEDSTLKDELDKDEEEVTEEDDSRDIVDEGALAITIDVDEELAVDEATMLGLFVVFGAVNAPRTPNPTTMITIMITIETTLVKATRCIFIRDT